MIVCTKLPVFIISSPRTGSTALGQQIAEINSLTYFIEPDYLDMCHRMNNFKSFAEANDSYVLKMHAKNLHKYPKFVLDKLKTNSTTIKISRKSLFDQVVSYYIARKTDHWVRKRNETEKSYELEYDADFFLTSLTTIKYFNGAFDSLDVIFDLELTYEDLNLSNSLFEKTIYPNNYNRFVEQCMDTFKNL